MSCDLLCHVSCYWTETFSAQCIYVQSVCNIDETFEFFKIEYGVRQGSVLSPSLFAVYLDDIVNALSVSQRHFIILYADDILIMA